VPPFNLEFKPSVEKDLRRLPKDVVDRILKRIEALREDPFPRGAIKLAGAERIFRARVGRYRIVYQVIQYVRHRRTAYE
jgi:mRNA interferase RelE/StbE